jgi:sulfofructose kinase
MYSHYRCYDEQAVCKVTDRGAKLVFVGAATLDVIATVDRFPHRDERCLAEGIIEAGGGPAATSAVTARRLGVEAAYVGVLGDDQAGDRILDGLVAEGVDVSGVIREPGGLSARSVVIVDRANGTRAICNRAGPSLRIPKQSRAANLVASAEIVHVDHVGWSPVAQLLSSAQIGPRVSVDEGNPIPDLAVNRVDLYAPTLRVLKHRYGDAVSLVLVNRAVAAGARWVVATDGSRGAAAAASGETATVPAWKSKIVSTLGAGDVFHGALVAHYSRGAELTACLRYASVAAALSCRAVDGRSGIPTHAEVSACLESAATSQ